MKIRNGFVSNSSSSSFIVGFDKELKNDEEVKELFFGELEQVDFWGDIWKTERLAYIIFRDIEEQKPNDFKEIRKLFREEAGNETWLEVDKLFPIEGLEYGSEEFWKQIGKQNKYIRKFARELFMKHCKNFKGKTVYIFEYEDHNANLEGIMYKVLSKLPILCVSHH